MKRILFLIFCCFSIHAFAQAQPALEMKIFPKYIEGGLDDRNGIPFVYRAKITGLTPGTTYRYTNKYVLASYNSDAAAAGMSILPPANVKPGIEGYTAGDFYRAPVTASGITNGAGTLKDYYGLLTADANGAYEGWFILETVNYKSAGVPVYVRIAMNNPAVDSAAVAYRLESPADQPLISVGMSSYDENMEGDVARYGTAIRSTPATSGIPKNMVFLYDNEEGTGRPVAGTVIENDGVRSALALGGGGLAPFYYDSVNGVNGAWGTMVLNTDLKGIRRIEQRSLADGSIVGVDKSADGFWPNGKSAGGTVSTLGLIGGGDPVVLDGSQVTLAMPKVDHKITFTNTFPSALTVGDAYFIVKAVSDIPELSAGIVYTASPANVFEISGDTVRIIGGGTATITASHPGNDIYARSKVSIVLTVAKATQTIDGFAGLSKTYGDTSFALPLNTSAGLPVTYTIASGDAGSIVLNGNKITIKGAGAVSITASQAGNSAVNAAADVTAMLVINKAALTVRADDKAMGVGQKIPSLTYTITGFKYTDAAADLNSPVVIATNASNAPATGVYDITVSGASSPDYDITFIKGKLSVYSSAQNVTFTELVSKVYGDTPFDPGAVSLDAPANMPVYTSSNPVVAIIENNKVKIVGAGSTLITANFAATGSLPPSTADQPLLVAKKQLIATANAASRMYGHTDPAFSATYSGFVNGDNESVITAQPFYITNTSLASPVGTYLVTPQSAAAANYSFIYKDGEMTIEKAVLKATAENKTRKYGAINPPLTVVYSDFVNGDTEASVTTKATASVTATSTSTAGTYPIIPSGGSASNYTFNYVSGILIISAAERAIQFNALPVKKAGDADFDPAAVVSTGETAVYTSLNPSVATIVNGKLHIVSGGSALIRASAPVSANYNTAPSAEQLLIVEKNTQTISFEVIPELSIGSGAYTIKATSSSGLPVSFGLVNSSLASIVGNKLTPQNAGTTQINAVQAGDGNYLPAPVVTHTLTITGSNSGVMRVHPAISPNGDGVNDFLVIDGITTYPQNKVKIVNRNGGEVYSVSGYDNGQQVFRGVSTSGKKLPQGTYFCLIEFSVDGTAQHITGYFILK